MKRIVLFLLLALVTVGVVLAQNDRNPYPGTSWRHSGSNGHVYILSFTQTEYTLTSTIDSPITGRYYYEGKGIANMVGGGRMIISGRILTYYLKGGGTREFRR